MRALLTAVLLVCLRVSPSAADTDGGTGERERWPITPRVIFIEDIPPGILPEDIATVELLIKGDPRNGCYLLAVGIADSRVYLGTVPFEMYLNPAKTYGFFSPDDSLLIVFSEYPSMTRTNSASYRWDEDQERLEAVGTWHSDWSGALLQSADSLLEIGEIRQATDSIEAMFYPYSYYDRSELSCRFLRAAHRASLSLFEQGRAEDAAIIYDDAADAFERIAFEGDWHIAHVSRKGYLAGPYSYFMGPEELASILSDFAEIFRAAGRAGLEQTLRNSAELLAADPGPQ